MKEFVLWILVSLLFISTDSHAQLVITVAGIVDSTGNNNGPVYDATFNNPHGIAVGIDGNVYTADRYSHTIRKITPTGIVSTLAGINGVSGSLDGPSTVATFNEPWGLCVDDTGNVLVADTRNNKIRKITPAGIVSTIAGNGNFGVADGPALFASFGNPTGIECDSLGNLFIADHLTHIIRKIDPAGNVTRLAGIPYVTGSVNGPGATATFNRPYGLTLDNQGNVIIADEWNHKIRKIAPTGHVSTISGSGLLGNDNGTANSATFNYPWDVTVDEFDNIFVADGYNYTIRRVLPSGYTTTYAGTPLNSGAVDGLGPAASFNGATAIAINPTTQELYVGDAYNELVRKIVNLNQGNAPVIAVAINGSGPIPGTDPVMLCPSETAVLSSNSPTDNQWYLNGAAIVGATDQTIAAVQSGIYRVEILGNTETSNSIEIELLPQQIIDFTIDNQYVTVGNSVSLEADVEGIVAFQWEIGNQSSTLENPTFEMNVPGSYNVLLTTSDGICNDTLLKQTYLTVQPEDETDTAFVRDIHWFLPNVFSPNNDGCNDVFYLRGDNLSDVSVAVYDKWGALLFATTDQSTGWQGDHSGQPVVEETYVYLVSFLSPYGKQVTTSGHVTVLR